jgi:hypothetical protein
MTIKLNWRQCKSPFRFFWPQFVPLHKILPRPYGLSVAFPYEAFVEGISSSSGKILVTMTSDVCQSGA